MPHSCKYIRFTHGNLVITAALFYLFLPCVLFSWEILTLPFACLTISGLSAGLVFCLYTLRKSLHQVYFFSHRDIFYLLLTLLLALGVIECLGFNLHVLQSYDFVVRNPIYDMLQHHELPLYSQRGEYFVYYHAFWLPPAYICRTCPNLNPDVLLYIWTYLGITISICMLFLRFKRHILTLCFILIILGMPFYLFTSYIRECTNLLTSTGLFKEAIIFLLGGFIHKNAFYTSLWAQIIATFNHAIPIFIVLSALIFKKLPFHITAFLAALVVPFSPLGALLITGILISLFIHRFKEKEQKIITKSIIISISASPLLIFSSVYFSLSGGAGASFFFSVVSTQGNYILNSLSFLSSQAIQWILIWITYLTFRKHNSIFHKNTIKQIIYITAISSFVWIGRNDTNELMYKTGAVLYPLLGIYIFSNRSTYKLRTFHKLSRIFLALVSTIWIAYDFYHRILPTYTWDKDKISANKRTEWGNTLDHPEHIWYGSFWAGKIPNPYIFKVREGTKAYVPNDGGKRP